MRRVIQTIVAAGLIAFSASTQAVVYSIFGFGDDFPAALVPFVIGDPTAELNQNTLFEFLQIVGPEAGFPEPSSNVTEYEGGTIPGGSYLVLYYQPPPAGGINVFFFDASEPTFDIPETGLGDDSFGPLGFALLYAPVSTVPEPASTLGLLGLSVAGISVVRRKLLRKS